MVTPRFYVIRLKVLGDDANVHWDPSVDERPSDALPETVQVLNIQSSLIDENLFRQNEEEIIVDDVVEIEKIAKSAAQVINS